MPFIGKKKKFLISIFTPLVFLKYIFKTPIIVGCHLFFLVGILVSFFSSFFIILGVVLVHFCSQPNLKDFQIKTSHQFEF
jgi:preprotein translocase subunit SecF